MRSSEGRGLQRPGTFKKEVLTGRICNNTWIRIAALPGTEKASINPQHLRSRSWRAWPILLRILGKILPVLLKGTPRASSLHPKFCSLSHNSDAPNPNTTTLNPKL